ncbi:hypothetical protein I547_5504 [Mycobacterium kansasii 824]|uniref:PE-PGRS family domain protein n=1 Tax=Mycobacterium kansasii TaxID=1768 RepID=A0A1V3X646_MYCKA|nr:hypothetical protein I547_5504 [Mycobacterium kansasii 824]OOK74266.1 PE-PGRS family domain protein [Mycobacterium kansasii]
MPTRPLVAPSPALPPAPPSPSRKARPPAPPSPPVPVTPIPSPPAPPAPPAPNSSPPSPPAPPVPPEPVANPPVPPAPPKPNSSPPARRPRRPAAGAPAYSAGTAITTDAAKESARATSAAGPAAAGSTALTADPACTAGAEEQPAATAGTAGTAVASARITAGPAGTAVTEEQPASSTCSAVAATDGTGATGTAVADQDSAVRSVCPVSGSAVGPVADQGSTHQCERGRIHHVQQHLKWGDVGGFGGRIGARRNVKVLHELIVEHCRLGAQLLICLGVPGKQHGNRCGYFIGSGGRHPGCRGRRSRVRRADRRAKARQIGGHCRHNRRGCDHIRHVTPLSPQ